MIKENKTRWTHIDALTKAGGQITVGQVGRLDCVALAKDDKYLYAALRRRDDESMEALLQRLDQAIELALTTNTHINESWNILQHPSTSNLR
jgi:hypothetical protein